MIKCKMCGGDLRLTEGSTIATCEYCGTQQTVPTQDSEKKIVQFERAERLRRNCEFDKAAGVYESIVADFRQEAEAYWGLVLCKYGIEYVDDPATGKKIPTCHRSSFDSVMEDPNFDLTMENADAVSLQVYRKEAKQIEEIRKGIIEVSAKEGPYDIFICYKETDAKGDRTVDSLIAQNIYDALTEKGYRIFFSRITLEDKLGVAYEPYIFAALNSAKVMLAVGTAYEHYNAVWVKNEWSRFLKLMEKDKSKHLIPCFKDIDAYDIPKEFKHLQAQDMGKVGAIQDLLRGIDKLLTVSDKKQKIVVSEGMSKQEKKELKAIKRSQQTSRFIIYIAILYVVAFFGAMLLRDADAWIFAPNQMMFTIHGTPSYVRDYYATPVPLIPPMLVAFPMAFTLAFGFKSKGVHWTNLIYLMLLSGAIIYFASTGIRIESFFVPIYLAVAFFPALTAVTAYWKKKITLLIHLAITLLIAVVTLLG